MFSCRGFEGEEALCDVRKVAVISPGNLVEVMGGNVSFISIQIVTPTEQISFSRKENNS